VPFVDFDEHDRPYVHPPIGDTKLHDQYLKEVVWNHPFGVNDVHWAMYIDYLRVVRRQAPPFLGTSDPYAAKKIANFHRWASDVGRHQRVLEFLFDEMADRAATLNATLVIFSMPSSEMAPASKAFLSAVKKAEAKHSDRLYFLDTYAALEQLVNDEGLAAAFIPDDGHPTPAAHGRIAGVLAPVVRKLAGQ